MSRTQIIILAALGGLTVLVCAVAGILLVVTLTAPAVAPAAVAVKAAATNTATRTPVPPIATATSTPVPATPTLVNAPATPINIAATNALNAALAKSKTSTKYRIDMGMTMKGDLGQLSYMTTANQELSLLGMSGEVSGQDSHLTLSGFIAAFLTGDPAKSLEMTQVGGKSYVHGPVPLLGAKDNRWYVLPDSQAASYKSSLNQGNGLDNLSGSAGFAAMYKTGTETLDTKRCDVYSGDRNAALAAFGSLSSTTQFSSSDYATLQAGLTKAEYQVWVCDDGYLHQIRMNLEGKDASTGGKAVGIKFYIHMWDFGGNIKIAAPTGAIAPSNPFQPSPSPAKK